MNCRQAVALDLMRDLIGDIASVRGTPSQVEYWRHRAQQLSNAYYGETEPCPVYLCAHCAEEREEGLAKSIEEAEAGR